MIRRAITSAVLMSVAFAAHAAPASPLYAGAAFGHADYRADCWGVESCDDTPAAARVYMGLDLNDAADGAVQGSIETTYYRGRRATASDSGIDASARIHGIGLAYKATWHTGALGLSARIGGAYTRSEVEVPGLFSEKDSEFGATYGLGASWRMTDAWALTLDADRVPAKYSDEKRAAIIYTAGVRYSF